MHYILEQEEMMSNIPYYKQTFDNIAAKFAQSPREHSVEFLDDQYKMAKQAIFERYRPPTKLTTLYSRDKANIGKL